MDLVLEKGLTLTDHSLSQCLSSLEEMADYFLPPPTNSGKVANISSLIDACNANYLQWMGMSLPGIVMTMSLWGTGDGGMAWLDGKSGCQGACNLAVSSVTFSNFRLDKL